MKTAIITGSSRGIGAATAEALAHAGWAVCINYKQSREKAEALAEKLCADGCSAVTFQADVSDADAVSAMVHYARAELGEIELLVNNAGIAHQIQFQDITAQEWQNMFNVNLGGCFNCTQAVLPHMLHEHSGCIVNISSLWGSHGASCEVAYSATKHAIIGLTRSLAAELAPSGIRVNCIAPGAINTDMVKALGQETLDDLAKNTIPLGRLGRADEIAQSVLHLVDNQYITGAVLAVDGGFII